MSVQTSAETAMASPERFRRRVAWAYGVVRRGKLLVAACMLLGVLPTILYLYNAERLYTAQAEILIESPESGENLLERSYGRSRLTETSIQTEADILSSSSLADKVIEKLRLDEDPEFNTALREPAVFDQVMASINPLPFLTGQTRTQSEMSATGRAALARTRIQAMFIKRLTVKALRRSFVISVQFTSNNPEKSARVANTLADLYVVERLEASYAESRRANDWLAERLESLRRDVNVAEQAAERYRVTNNLGERGRNQRESTVTGQQLVELNSRLVVARADLAQKQARYHQALALTRSQGSLDTASDVLQSSLIQRLREQETVKQRELSEATKTYGERHPRIIGYRADLDELRQKISDEIKKIAGALANEVATAQAGVNMEGRSAGSF
ncbi:MAG TPA: GumC family protein [Magnetospirillum sp.]|nr:GumC family protein [Magnetospirillum sp.]